MRFLVRLLVTIFALWVAIRLVPGLEFDGSLWALAGIALVFGLINAFVKPIITLLSLPLILVTLGLFVLVINAIAFLLVVWISGALDLGLTSDGFWPAFWGAIVVSIVSWAVNALVGDD